MLITKSDFLSYRNCSSDFWYLKHMPSQRKEQPRGDFAELLISQGYLIEDAAYRLFPEGVSGVAYSQDDAKFTQTQIDDGNETIMQATFQYDGLLARVDILQWNPLQGGWDINEIKSTSSEDGKTDTKPQHLDDAAFQKYILEGLGVKVANVYLIEVNKQYIRQGALDYDQLFVRSEVGTEIDKLDAGIAADIAAAKALLTSTDPPYECQCRYRSRKKHCASYSIMYPGTPAYSVYDLQRIGSSKKKLATLVNEGSLKLSQVTPDHKLSQKQTNQIETYLHDDPIINHNGISDELALLEYPLYFLDYESSAPAIPAFEGTWPYQQVPFQYSLHIQEAPDAPYIHKEYLHTAATTPMHILAERLREDIGDTGTVIVWYKPFESSRNKELADANPTFKPFLLGLNERIYDLMDIFAKHQYYVHKDFRGSASIKAVLPVLCPDLDYKALSIGDGGTATTKWREMIFGDLPQSDRDQIAEDLLVYCKLDTWAMVRILEEVRKVVS